MTVERVVNGTYNMQKRWIETHELGTSSSSSHRHTTGWNTDKAQRSAQEMYDRIFNMKFLPPGRGLWAMGTELTGMVVVVVMMMKFRDAWSICCIE